MENKTIEIPMKDLDVLIALSSAALDLLAGKLNETQAMFILRAGRITASSGRDVLDKYLPDLQDWSTEMHKQGHSFIDTNFIEEAAKLAGIGGSL